MKEGRMPRKRGSEGRKERSKGGRMSMKKEVKEVKKEMKKDGRTEGRMKKKKERKKEGQCFKIQREI